jgi:hypothetical protein
MDLCQSGALECPMPSAYVGMQSLTAVLCLGNDVAMPRQHLPRFDESSSLDTSLASGLCVGHTTSTYVRYSLSGLRHLPPRMKNQRGSMKKNLNRIKKDLSIECE